MRKVTGIGKLKSFRYFALLFVILSGLATIVATGGGDGGGDSSSSTGTLSMDIADAKPLLPAGTENVWITFEEVFVHKSGGGWISLPLAQTPYTIDLHQFYNGNSTHLVPPVSLETGKYTQIRIVITEAAIKIDDTIFPVTIPSENLKIWASLYCPASPGSNTQRSTPSAGSNLPAPVVQGFQRGLSSPESNVSCMPAGTVCLILIMAPIDG